MGQPIDQAYHNQLDAKHAGLAAANEPVIFTKSDGTQYQISGAEALDAMHLLGERGYEQAMAGDDRFIEKLVKYSQMKDDIGEYKQLEAQKTAISSEQKMHKIVGLDKQAGSISFHEASTQNITKTAIVQESGGRGQAMG